MQILQQREEKDVTGTILEVTISPAGTSNDSVPSESAETKMLGKIKDIRKNLSNTTP
jgi:hypothetical protein